MPDPAVTRFLSRRRLLQFGAGGYLGLNLGGLWTAQAAARPVTKQPIRACIFVFLYGGPSHIDTFDPKPNAPADIRGEFNTTATSAPGVRICEHLPRMAKVMHKVAVVRSVHHAAHLHDSGSIHVLTGRPLDGPDRELFAPLPQQFPSYGSAVARFRPGAEVPFAALPFPIHNVVETPCQGGGFLGAAHDPLRIDVDPAGRKYDSETLRPAAGMDSPRLAGRRRLLQTLDPAASMGDLYAKAYRLLDSEMIRDALDISREPPAVRDRYGFGAEPGGPGEIAPGNGGELGYAKHMRGQNLLLARRLVEAGVPFVNVFDFKQQGQNWDAHGKGASQHKNHLLPGFDTGLSALIDDLDQRGLLDSTLIVVSGEFGRTPKINAGGGRDHYPECYSVLLAGGGVNGGAVYGASDRLGATPALDPVTPADIAATIYWRFGIDPATEVRDRANRPYTLAAGDPLAALFA